jgi:hypothetical protein
MKIAYLITLAAAIAVTTPAFADVRGGVLSDQNQMVSDRKSNAHLAKDRVYWNKRLGHGKSQSSYEQAREDSYPSSRKMSHKERHKDVGATKRTKGTSAPVRH